MTMPAISLVERCRACGGSLAIGFCHLGEQPLANSYVRPCDAAGVDARFPLEVRVCADCRLAQLSHVVDEHAIFSDYAYLSSTSTTWLAHAAEFSRWAIAEHALDSGSFVVEIASNDGYLLCNFVAADIPCVGVEPAENVARIAIAAGVPTEVAFFGEAVADQIVRQQGRTADLVVANNVLAHVPDLRSFVAGLARLAGTSGVISIEVPHLMRLIRGVQFDTIYHEHYAYWSLFALERLFASHGLAVFDVHTLATHGGSLRVLATASPKWRETSRLAALRAEEHEAGLGGVAVYQSFDAKVAKVVGEFCGYLAAAKAEGRVVAGYGAAAKGNTFINRAGLTSEDIPRVADANPLKRGTLLPGSRIPVVDTTELLESGPDDIIILPWNLRAEIKGPLRTAGFGGRLVTAIPSLVIE